MDNYIVIIIIIIYTTQLVAGWLLVFRAMSGIGPDPYLAFTNGTNVTSDDASCQTLYVTSCGRHYRSPFVDYWVNLSISKVTY